jgi:hypothetical protein
MFDVDVGSGSVFVGPIVFNRRAFLRLIGVPPYALIHCKGRANYTTLLGLALFCFGLFVLALFGEQHMHMCTDARVHVHVRLRVAVAMCRKYIQTIRTAGRASLCLFAQRLSSALNSISGGSS